MGAEFTVPVGASLKGGPSLEGSEKVHCDASHVVPGKALPVGRSQYEVAFTLETLRVVAITCDKDIVIRTNDPDRPGDVLPLEAGRVFSWHHTSRLPIPFREDVSSIFVDAPEGGKLTVLWGTDPEVKGPGTPGPGVIE